MASRFTDISGEEIKLAEKAVNKTWRNVWKSKAKNKGLNDDIMVVKNEAE